MDNRSTMLKEFNTRTRLEKPSRAFAESMETNYALAMNALTQSLE
jgi:hypothetical protein